MSNLIIVYTVQKHEVFYSTVKAHIWDVETQKSLCGALRKGSRHDIWYHVASKVKRPPSEDERCKICARKADFFAVISAWEQRMVESAATYEAKRQAEWAEAERQGWSAYKLLTTMFKAKFANDPHARLLDSPDHGLVLIYANESLEITLGIVKRREIGGNI